MQRFDAGGEQAGRQQGPLDRVGGLSRREHRLDVVGQRAEEIGQRLAGRKTGQIHLRRQRCILPGDSNRDRKILDQAREHQERAFQAVGVFDPVQDRVGGERRELRKVRKNMCRTRLWAMPVESCGRGMLQRARGRSPPCIPRTAIQRLPHVRASEGRDRANAGLASLAALHHALE